MSNLDEFVQKAQQQIIDEARAVYSETVVEHWMHPRSFEAMEAADGHGKILGPCGDTMEIFLHVREGEVTAASFLTDGCITSIASGSMAVELVTGRPLSEVRQVSPEDILKALGGLPKESEHCALLASNTLRAAVDDYESSRG